MKYIIVIDDSSTIRMSVSFALKDLGFRIEQAQNGSEALEKIMEIKESDGDIVLYITDVNMPVMDGITFVREIRKTDKFTPILILTTESENNMIQAGKEAGASGWIIKPFKADQLLAAVQKVVK